MAAWTPGFAGMQTRKVSVLLGFQRELPQSLVMDLSYVGSATHKLFVNEELNPILPGGSRLYPTYGRRQIRGNSGNSNYHALQARLDRRFSKGVQLTGSGRSLSMRPAKCSPAMGLAAIFPLLSPKVAYS